MINKKFKISKNLIELNKLLKNKLFIVGGYVRNKLLNLPTYDIDIASSLSIEEIFSLLNDTKYLVKLRSAKMGTIEIFVDNEIYQHTTFRKDTYNLTGIHSPIKTDFINDWEIDAQRRDFTVNSLYYNIKEDKIYDNFNGLKDLDKKTLKCINDSDIVFKEDALRLLRLVRFATELNFDIDEETKISATKNAKNLKEISGERKKKELIDILNCNNKYNNNSNLLYGIELLFDLKLINKIFDFKNIKWVYSKEFFIDLPKIKNQKDLLFCFLLCLYDYLNSQVEIDFGLFIKTVSNRSSLNLSNKETKYLDQLLKAYYFSNNITNYRKFIFKNFSVLEDLIKYLYYFNKKAIANNLEQEYQIMKNEKVPFTLKELHINGNDLLKINNIENTQINKILNKLLRLCVFEPNLNKKEILLNKANEFINKNI